MDSFTYSGSSPQESESNQSLHSSDHLRFETRLETTTPNPDYEISGGGSIFIVIPLSAEARENLENGVGEARWWAGGVAVEHRYLGSLVEQLREEGWSVRGKHSR